MKAMRLFLANLALVPLLAVPALAEGTFTIIDELPFSIFPGAVFMSDDGQVISGDRGGLFTWTAADGVVYLENPVDASGGNISGDGQSLAVSFANGEGLFAAGYWNPTDLFQLMDPIPEAAPCGSDLSSAYDLNHDGTVGVGLAWIGCEARAFKWTLGAGAVNLGSSGNSSRATAISSDGSTTVGFDEHPEAGYRRPAIWTDDVAGPQLIAGEELAGECYAASSDGSIVVGEADFGAMYWDDVVGYVDLGTLPGDEGFGALAFDVSDDGIVVGYSGNPFFSAPRAFVWTVEDGMETLADYLTERGVTGWENVILYNASAISDDGLTIAGIYQDPVAFPPFGVYVVQLDPTVAVDEQPADPQPELPRSVRLDGAYPNPFNPATTVKFGLDRAQNVRLSVYNMAGERVAVLADRAFAAGDHRVRWEGLDRHGQAVPSGTYLLELEAEAGVRSQKMMLVR